MQAEEEIYVLMRNDPFKRFKNSTLYSEMENYFKLKNLVFGKNVTKKVIYLGENSPTFYELQGFEFPKNINLEGEILKKKSFLFKNFFNLTKNSSFNTKDALPRKTNLFQFSGIECFDEMGRHAEGF